MDYQKKTSTERGNDTMPAALLHQKLMLPTSIKRLGELAYNLWFSWNAEASALFQRLDSRKWEDSGHNPVQLLLTSADALQQASVDPGFLEAYEQVISQFDAYMHESTWFQTEHAKQSHIQFAYFSAEFGFHESLPIYSGGLGVLAGDHCKSASDLGVPLTGVGLLYKKGYFTQKINSQGDQQAEQFQYDFSMLPILPAYQENNQELIVHVELPTGPVALKVWRIRVGRNSVYLLDADIESNTPADRQLTAQLYGGNQDMRISQEMILGMGGVKALRALGISPSVYHMNEGHAAFLTLERLRELLDLGLPFQAAVETIRSATVFTTHTPVAAGHDAFPIGMAEYYLGPLLSKLPAYRQDLLGLGNDPKTGLFNMTHLALHTSSLRNGVSKLHGQVSRDMFKGFYGDIQSREVPIDSITNGVHLDTWLAPEWKALFDRFLPGGWRNRIADARIWESLELIPDASIWQVHQELKEKLIGFARQNLEQQRRRIGESEERAAEVRSFLSKDALTIGFARRFATYKRANLIFNDLERLKKLLHDPERPVQILFAGKAHPADHPGQEMIREIYRVSQLPEFQGKIVMLENYDMNMARYLVQGVDVWLNNPRRPLEASGTSGQKAAMNGVINFSVLDGWWEEGYNGDNGWAIGSTESQDWAVQEQENTADIYRILESSIIPLYFSSQEQPQHHPRHPWINLMKRSIQSLAPIYNTHRMVAEYTERSYLPTADRAHHFVENGYDLAIKVADYKNFIRREWHHVKIAAVHDPSADSSAAVSSISAVEKLSTLKEVTADVFFGPIWPPDTLVELIYFEESGSDWNEVVVWMQATGDLKNQTQSFKASIPSHLKHGPNFSIRVRPISSSFAHSFELPLSVSTLQE
ncbi:alpha-glucan family phosphorylase [Paenibacillus eucommiae]|uniref:Starch phosphorylase n=1 Tax=Paenibacillus eucommiae TaxID=1355755 RepID=A0ABS4IZR0_9BACL|nr:alpha-glucan family phosphorylase [Paenibacillus eucommiae]MBP1993079.1 starch phosphorylase [Paenibacillus eucommiae]